MQKLDRSGQTSGPSLNYVCELLENTTNSKNQNKKQKNMKIQILSLACVIGGSFGALAQPNLILNPNFTVGGSPSGANWSSSFNGTYFYNEPTLQTNIVSAGWANGGALWQNTTATIQAGYDYTYSIQAQVGQAPVTGLNLSLQDVSLGWTVLANQDFTFASQSTGPSQWETFTLNIPASSLSSVVGDTIGVGITMIESPSSQNGWIWADSVSLVATPVPEPASLALLGMGAIGGLTMLRRNKKQNY